MTERTVLVEFEGQYIQVKVNGACIVPENPPIFHEKNHFEISGVEKCIGIGANAEESLKRFYEDVKSGDAGGKSEYALITDERHKVPTGHAGGDFDGKSSNKGLVHFLNKK